MIETSRETFSTNITTGMTVYLPTGQYNRMSSRFIGDNQERSIMRAIKEDNPWTQRTGNPVEFRSVPELAKAGASSADRMIVACRDDRVFEMGVSIMPRVIEVMSKGPLPLRAGRVQVLAGVHEAPDGHALQGQDLRWPASRHKAGRRPRRPVRTRPLRPRASPRTGCWS